VEKVKLTYQVLKKLPDVLRDNQFHINAVLKKNGHGVLVYDVLPAEDKRICGLAIDIGTTTVSAVILDMETGELLAKASAGNGQIRYGADVINRIIEQQKDGGRKKLQDAIVEETLNPLIGEMCRNLSYVCGIQYDYEPPVCRCQCGSASYGALYSDIF